MEGLLVFGGILTAMVALTFLLVYVIGVFVAMVGRRGNNIHDLSQFVFYSRESRSKYNEERAELYECIAQGYKARVEAPWWRPIKVMSSSFINRCREDFEERNVLETVEKEMKIRNMQKLVNQVEELNESA